MRHAANDFRLGRAEFCKPDIGATAAKAHFVPQLTSSSTVQRTAQFPEAATRVQCSEGVERAHITVFLHRGEWLTHRLS